MKKTILEWFERFPELSINYWISIYQRAMNEVFNTPIESDLISFGNYLLSDERNEAVDELNKQAVTHADIENWKLLKATK